MKEDSAGPAVLLHLPVDRYGAWGRLSSQLSVVGERLDETDHTCRRIVPIIPGAKVFRW